MKRVSLTMRWVLASALLTLAAGGQALGGNTWDGGGTPNANWSTGANWNPDGAPLNNGTAAIHMAGVVNTSPNVDAAWDILSLTFDNTASPFTLSGATLTIRGNVQNADADLQTISNPISIMIGTFHFDAWSGDLAIGGAVNNNGNLLTVWGSHNTTISGVISGNGGLTKTESGTLRLSGSAANLYAGTTSVDTGTLELSKTVGVAVPGNLTITGGTVRLLAANQISTTNTTAISGTGTLDLNGSNQTLGDIDMTGGSVTTGAGTLALGAGGITTNANSTSATITGNVSMGGVERTFAVADGGAAIDLEVSGVISTGSLRKTDNGTLRFSGTAANAYTGMTTVTAGTLELAKTSGTIAVADDLTINGGTVRLAASGQIALTQTTTVNAGGTLELAGYNQTIDMLIMGGGAVTTGAGTLTLGPGSLTANASGTTATVSGNLNLGGGTQTFTVADGGAAPDLDISAVIINGGVTKNGTGTLRFGGSSANTYGGMTTVNAGVLELAKTAGTFAFGGGLTINGGTVRLAASNQFTASLGMTINNSGTTLDLAGFNQTVGALYMNGGAVATGAGTLTLGSGGLTTGASGTTATVSGKMDLGGATRTISVADGGAITDLDISAAISNGGITKADIGTLRFSGSSANAYTGTTTVNAGILELSKSGIAVAGNLVIGDGVGGPAADVVRILNPEQIADTATVTIASSGQLQLQTTGYESIQDLVMSGGSVSIGSSAFLQLLGNLTTTGSGNLVSGSGVLTFSSGTHTLDVADGPSDTDLEISHIDAMAGTVDLTKAGAGTLRLTGNTFNYWSGTTVNSGTLVLARSTEAIPGSLVIGDGVGTDTVRLESDNQIYDAAPVTINSSGVLDLFGHIDTIGALTLNGGQVTTGAGTLTLSGNVTGNASAATATISGNLSLGGATRTLTVADGAADPDLDISAVISQGNLTKQGTGTLKFSGSSANIYTGTTTVNAGTLLLAKGGLDGAIAGNLVIGDGAGADIVRYLASNQIPSASGTVTVNSSGLLDLAGFTDTIYNLTLAGGAVNIGSASLTITGAVTTTASATTATISGNLLYLNGTTRTFDIADGAAAPDLDISAVISNGGLTKNGQGTLRLSGSSANTYGGMTTVNAGVLELAKTAGTFAFGGGLTINGGTVRLAASNQFTASLGMTIYTGGTLDLAGFNQTVGTLYMYGGAVTTGAGTLTLGSGGLTTGVSATTATVSGKVDLGGATRTITVADGGVASDLDISAAISNGGITKADIGTLRFSGSSANTYTGVTTVNAGTLELVKSSSVTAIAGNLVIGDGAGGAAADVVRILSDNQIADTATVTIASSGQLQLQMIGYESIQDLVMSGGSVSIGSSAFLQLLGNLTTTGSGNLVSGSGALTFSSGKHTLDVADGPSDTDLEISHIDALAGTVDLTKAGAGTLRLTGNSFNYWSGTTVNSGVLVLARSTNAIPGNLVIGDGAGGAAADVVRILNSEQIADTASVNIESSGQLQVWAAETIQHLWLLGGSVNFNSSAALGLTGDLTSSGSGNLISGTGRLTFSSGMHTVNVADGPSDTDLEIASPIDAGLNTVSLTKAGAGTLKLSGNSHNYLGFLAPITVNSGVLVLAKDAGFDAVPGSLVVGDGSGTDTVRLESDNQINDAAPVTVNSSGILDLFGHAETIGTLTLNGGQVTTGAGTLILSGNVMSGASTATGAISGSLSLGGATRIFTVADGAPAVDLDIPACIFGGSLTKEGAGTLKFSGSTANTYTGTTTVNAGTLLLAKSVIDRGVFGDLVVGDAGGGAGADIVRYLADNQIPSTWGAVTVNSSGLLDLNGFSDAIYNLTLNGGAVTTGAGTLTLGSGSLTTGASGTTATVSGHVDLGTATQTISVADGAAAPDLDVSAAISSGGLTKTGIGTLRLSSSAANTYAGTTTVNAGTLELSKTGSANAVFGDLIINGGGTVRLLANNQIYDDQTVTLNSGGLLDTGIYGDGIANLVLSGGTVTNSGAGTLNVWESAVLVNAAATPSTVSGTASFLLGATGDGALLKNGAGTLTLGADSNLRTVTVADSTLATGSTTLTVPLGGTFSQTGGTFTGTLRSQGTFSFTAGTFGGRLINEGALSIPASFTAGNGIQNFSNIALPAGQTVTCNGLGLDNESVITFAGGTLNGAATLLNNAIVSGYGTLGGSGSTFTNNGQVTVGGGNLTVAGSAANSNAGNIDLAPGLQLRLTGATLTNTGTINLGGGTVGGTASLSNSGGGTIAGRGMISSPFANSGGTLRATGGTVNVTHPFANSGLVELISGAGLSGGTITNTGAIQGAGSVANGITNSGHIEAVGGTLSLGSCVTNGVGGTIAAGTGGRVFMAGGLTANAGILSLEGGIFDNNGFALANSGQISGRGTLRTGGLTNNGGIGFSAGITDVYGDVTNPSGGTIIVTGGATVTFYDDVVHDADALFQLSKGSSVVFFGYSGTGSISGSGGTIYMEGDLRPGHSPGEVSFDGDLALGGGATLVAELAGTTPGSQYDVVDVGGSLALGGTLDVDLLYGFRPQAGQTFDILNFDPANLSGEFDAIALPDLGGGLAWDTSNLYTTGTLGVVPEPATLALVGLGALALVRRKRSR